MKKILSLFNIETESTVNDNLTIEDITTLLRKDVIGRDEIDQYSDK